MKQFVKLDTTSISPAALAQITANANLSAVMANVHVLTCDPAVFTHAYLLLGQSPTQFGTDLTLYLATTRAFFERRGDVDTIDLAFADTDMKKRLSEDLGVALGSVLMVDSFSIRWDTIAQIPDNRKLSSKRPDFAGFDTANKRYLYEAKGRSDIKAVPDALSSALGQVKKYPVAAEGKYAVVSYFSSDTRLFPSTTFMVDPPVFPEIVLPEPSEFRQLHYAHALRFLGLDRSRAVYLDLLSAKFSLRQAVAAGARSVTRYENQVRERGESFASSIEESRASLQLFTFGVQEFVGRRIQVRLDDRTSCWISLGLQSQILDAMANLDFSSRPVELHSEGDYPEFHTVFPDGTFQSISFAGQP